MFYTVFSTDDRPYMQWQADLLEYTWKRVGQPGQLVRLVATNDPQNLPRQQYARCFATTPWNTHPRTGDNYPIYNKPASLLEWLYAEKPEGTVLFMDPDCVFRRAVTQRVAPGSPVSQNWVDLHLLPASKTNPFGLSERFWFLHKHCADVELQGDAVMIPTLIHTSDLRKICARWLELCSFVREFYRYENGERVWESDMFAYVVACAEYGIRHEKADLGICTNWDAETMPDSPIIHYCQSIHDLNDRVIFNKHQYAPWQLVDVSVEPRHYYGRDLVQLINAKAQEMTGVSPSIPSYGRPNKGEHVKEGRVLDDLLLAIPAQEKSLWLNSSGKLIWDLCDGDSTVEEISSTISARFDVGPDLAAQQVGALLGQLRTIGFIELR
ncbi:MAG: PqqD family protein [Pseudomonadota bacterium]